MKRKKIVSVIAILLAVLMLASLVVSMIPASAFADELDDLKRQRDELSARREECESRIESLMKDQANALEQKAALDEQKRIAQEELELVSREIERYDTLILEKGQEVDEAKNREANQLRRYRERVRAMEEFGGFNILAIIARAESFAELLSEIDDYAEVMTSDRELQEQYLAAREETEAIMEEYEQEKLVFEAEQAELRKDQEALNEKIERTDTFLEQLADDIEQAKKEYEEAEAAEEAASAQIASMVAEMARQKAAAAAAAAQQAQAELQQMQEANAAAAESGAEAPYSEEQIQQVAETVGGGYVETPSSGYMWPVPCSSRVTSRFGYRSDPFTGASAYHSGIDIDGYGNDGNIIVASASGTVTTASFDGAYGNYVIIDHGSTQTLYAHMSGIAVSFGSYVSQGQTIGYLGATGRATGTHCHFEVFVNGERTDPISFCGFGGISYYNC